MANFATFAEKKILHEHDKKILHFFEEGMHFITHFDGSFFTTLKTIFTSPGQLSLDYCSGIRKKYFKPLSFFLLLVVLYLLFPLFSGLNQPLSAHLNFNIYRNHAQHVVTNYLNHHPITAEQLAEKFQHTSEKTSKILLLIILPLCAFPLWLMNYREKKYFYDHLIFSTEANSFFLVFSFFIYPLASILLAYLLGLMRLPVHRLAGETVTGIIIYVVFAVFLAIAFKRFYNVSRIRRALIITGFILFHMLILFAVYRFLLFSLVMLTL